MQELGVKARIMPKKPNDNSPESTLGSLARVLGEIDANKTSADKPAEIGPEEPGGVGDSGSALGGEAEKGEALPEGETREEL
jgi:hypothetical protein